MAVDFFLKLDGINGEATGEPQERDRRPLLELGSLADLHRSRRGAGRGRGRPAWPICTS